MVMRFEFEHIGGNEVRTAGGGRPGRPTVIATNALPQSIRCWESLWDRLTDRFHVLAVDLPGFGMSSGGGAIMRPSSQAEWLTELLDARGIDRAFFIGPDIGVPVVLSLASAHPERVAGINILDGPGTWPTDFHPRLRAATSSRLVRWLADRPPMRRRLMAENLHIATEGGYHRFRPSEAARAEYDLLCHDPVKHRNAFDFLGSYPTELPLLEQRLPSVTVPTLITWGALDPYVLPSNAHRLQALLPNSEVTVFDEAGHFSHEDADDAWLDRFTGFVEANLPAADRPQADPRRTGPSR